MKVEITIPIKNGQTQIGSISTKTNFPSGLVGAAAAEPVPFKMLVLPGHKKIFKLIVKEYDTETGITKMGLSLLQTDSIQLDDFNFSILTDRKVVTNELSAAGWAVSFDEVAIKGIVIKAEQAKEMKKRAAKARGTFKLFTIKRLHISIGVMGFVLFVHYMSGEPWKSYTFVQLVLVLLGAYGTLTIENLITTRQFNKLLRAV